MQPLENFNDNLGTAICLTGAAGAGKTSLAMRLFPRTYVFVADLNFSSGIRYLRERGELANVVGYDAAAVDENAKVVPVLMRYSRMLNKITEAQNSNKVDCIVLDSASFIEDIIKAKICNAQNEAAIKLSGFDQWGSLILVWKSLISQARQSGKKFIITAHETKEKDESDGIFKCSIALDGKIASKFPALFSDLWRCEIEERLGKHEWKVRTLSNSRQEHLKNTFGLPNLCSHDEVIKKVRESCGTSNR